MWVSAVALALTAVLLVAITLMRAARRWRAARLQPQADAWREALHRSLDGAQGELPPIGKDLLPDFVGYWNHMRATLKGAAAVGLSQLLHAGGLEERVLAMLESPSLRMKLLAATALGFMREERAWDALARIARDPSAPLSFAAAQALVRIAPAAALDLLATDIVEREDWSIARLGGLFREIGPDAITAALARIVASRPRRGAHRAVKLARFGQRSRMQGAVRDWLRTSDDPEVLAAALDYADFAEDMPYLRGAARHADWRVRMASARALGRVGSREELATLLQLLQDPQWWVRYHAAQAITRLHGLAPAEVEALQGRSRDPFAADMLAHALADREAAS